VKLATVTYELSGPIATITMNRPEIANAQNTALIDELDTAFGEAEADDNVRVVILAGAGNHFSSGHDLKHMIRGQDVEGLQRQRATPEGRMEHERTMYYGRCQRIYDFPKPTIAAVQGSCLAAGLMLACMCDLIVAADNAKFQNFVLRGAGAGVELLVEPWELGVRKAKEFLLTGDPIDAAEAWRLGLVNRVVPLDRLMDEAKGLAERIASVPPVVATMVKDSLNHAWDLMGKRDSWKYHFIVHQWTHNTSTALGIIEQRKNMTSMSEIYSAREQGDQPTPTS
jgi:enoyl-CoA hydratase